MCDGVRGSWATLRGLPQGRVFRCPLLRTIRASTHLRAWFVHGGVRWLRLEGGVFSWGLGSRLSGGKASMPPVVHLAATVGFALGLDDMDHYVQIN